MRLNTVPPQPGQVQATSWVMVSRGRCGGSGLRTGCMRSRRLTGWAGVLSGAVARLGSTGIPFEFADQQLKLLDRVVELLGGAAETRAAQHRQLHLQLLDM
jgi:hypothetical protein